MKRILGAIAGATLTACTAAQDDTSAARGQAVYAEKCAVCHGASGVGDGPMALQLFQPPPDLTRISARNGGAFPRDYVMGAIDGFQRRDHFSGAMPAFGDADLGPLVAAPDGTPVPAMLLALAAYLEQIQTP